MLDAMATYPARREDLMPCEQRGQRYLKFMVSSSHYAWCHSDDGDGGGGLTLILHVQPGAKRTEVIGVHDNALKIRLAAAPVEGAANAVLVAFLAEVFGVPQRQVVLKRGNRSRRKVIEIIQAARGPEVLQQERIALRLRIEDVEALDCRR